jgi:hypothetical protein
MTIRKRAGSVLFIAAAAAAVVGMSVGPALASTSLTVKVTGGGSYTAKAGKTVLTDGTGASAVSVTCSSSKGSGKIANGSHHGAAPVSVGTVAKLSFSNCNTALGSVTTTVHGKPELKADSKTNSKGETDAIITGVDVTVSIPSAGCSLTVTGSAPGYYTNSKHTLTMTSKLPVKAAVKATLTIGDVTGCLGVVTDGQHPTYAASYKVSRKITIKSR